uniref:Uncharacterized protein n=1 Tax=Triticum urartu TaxID=4572 RepID=A0A8R7UVR9_TRIUA
FSRRHRRGGRAAGDGGAGRRACRARGGRIGGGDARAARRGGAPGRHRRWRCPRGPLRRPPRGGRLPAPAPGRRAGVEPPEPGDDRRTKQAIRGDGALGCRRVEGPGSPLKR